MKKALLLIAALISLAAFNSDVFARVTGTAPTNPDAFCAGGDGAEACIDASGNVIPTTDNDATLGTSSLRFSGIHAYDLSLTDDLTVADDATVTGDLSVTGGLFKVMASTVVPIDGGSVTVADASCGGVLRIAPTTDIQTSIVNTFSAPSATNAGCVVTIAVASTALGTITLDDNALFDTGLGYPSAGSIVLGTDDVIMIASLGTKWILIGTIIDN